MEPKDSLPCSQGAPLVPVLIQVNPVHTFPPYFTKITFPSAPTFFQWPIPFMFSKQNIVWISHISHAHLLC